MTEHAHKTIRTISIALAVCLCFAGMVAGCVEQNTRSNAVWKEVTVKCMDAGGVLVDKRCYGARAPSESKEIPANGQ